MEKILSHKYSPKRDTLADFLCEKDQLTAAVINYLLDFRLDCYIGHINSLVDILEYFLSEFKERENAKIEDFVNEWDYEKFVSPLNNIKSLISNFDSLNDKFEKLNGKEKETITTPNFDPAKLYELLLKFQSDTNLHFETNKIATSKIDNTVDRIERDLNPKPKHFEKKDDFITALAKSDAKKL